MRLYRWHKRMWDRLDRHTKVTFKATIAFSSGVYVGQLIHVLLQK